ncbi:zinc finger BED domain-containing protein RICESLEEPER 1-like [Tripterygium wilfordii]|uniref:zinc finger BED domain-containing protein RICESLEEPER 1-like n=1 Tax=Tripterygium wilfordii TaxID=458696 RepID=UPI0018F7F70D|nr:zinc finger BED domain-containing protein RICESLEEPER 1-like [Tripterygium wilfordii]
MDVCTRWNSTYLMLEQALKFSKVFDMLSLLDSGFQDYFKDHKNTRCSDAIDWMNAKEFVSYLNVFYEATLKLSASKILTAHLVFKQLLNIQMVLNKAMMKPQDDTLYKVAANMKKKFEKYWGNWENVNRFTYLAVVLDPRYKLPYLGFQLNKVGIDSELVKKTQDEVKKMFHDMFREYGEMVPRRNQPIDGENVGDSDEEDEEGSDDEDENEDDMLYHQSLRENQVVALSDEVDRYLHEPHLEVKKNKFKILPYWKAGVIPNFS